MQAGDLVAVISTLSGIGSLQQFTADKRMLHAAIDRIHFSTYNRVGVSSFRPVGYAGPFLSGAAEEERNGILTIGTLQSIRYVIAGLRKFPGRKSLILFSESLGNLSESTEMARTGRPLSFIP